MGKSSPQAPAAPNYAEANRAGVQADLDALPLRNAINAASTLGTTYTDPNTGQTYDFTGLGSADIANQQLQQQLSAAPGAAAALLKIQQEYGPQFAEAARESLRATDPTGFALREQFGANLAGGGNRLESLAAGLSAPQFEQLQGSGPDMARLGNIPGLSNLTAADLPSLRTLSDSDIPALRNLADSDAPTFDRLSSLALADTGAARDGRSVLERQIFDELAKAGTGDPYLERAAQQAARARGAATGNTFGDGAALNESLKVQSALRGLDNQRRGDALSLLQSGQTASDKGNALSQQNFTNEGVTKGFNNAAAQQGFTNRSSILDQNNRNAQQTFQNRGVVVDQNNQAAQQTFQNRGSMVNQNNTTAQQNFNNQGLITEQNNQASNQAFQNAMNAINQRNQAAGNTFAGQQSVVQQQMGARQQDTANVQSYLGLTPIVSQGAQLSGLQQGAAPVTTGSGYQAVGTNPNAGQLGSAFAGNVFGTQAGIYGTQMQNASNPFGALAGSFLGAATGGVGQGAGAALTKKLFG